MEISHEQTLTLDLLYYIFVEKTRAEFNRRPTKEEVKMFWQEAIRQVVFKGERK